MVLRVGVAGLGNAAVQVLEAFGQVDGVILGGAADFRPEARGRFQERYRRPAFESVEALCQSPEIDAIWVATPNRLHAEHAIAAANNGKHVLCEKPLAVSLAESDAMIAAAQRNGVQLLAAHSKIFDTPIQAIRRIVADGRLGPVIQIQTILYNNWLQRPRLAAELDTSLGGGVVFRQAPHLVDIVRYIGGGVVRSVRALAGRHDRHFPTEGNFACLLDFASGATATIGFNGYGHFDSRELTWGIGVYGAQLDDPRGMPRQPRRHDVASSSEKYSVSEETDEDKAKKRMPFFGLTIVSCASGVIRQSPDGLYVYDDNGCTEVEVVPNLERAAELIELRDALREGRSVFPDGRWGAATLEVCRAILDSARLGCGIVLERQVPCP